jgi:ankyrin repeat protein
MLSAKELLQIRFHSLCGKLSVEKMKIILAENKLDIHYMEDYAFIVACAYNNLDMVKYLLDISMEYSGIKFDIHTENDKALIWACAHGKLDTVKYLLDISVEYSGTPIDIEANLNEAFRSACKGGYFDIAKLLIEKTNYKLNIHLYHDYAFRWLCIFNKLNSLKFMVKHYRDIKIDAMHCDAMKEAIKNNYNDIVLYLLQLGGYHMDGPSKRLIYI